MIYYLGSLHLRGREAQDWRQKMAVWSSDEVTNLLIQRFYASPESLISIPRLKISTFNTVKKGRLRIPAQLSEAASRVRINRK